MHFLFLSSSVLVPGLVPSPATPRESLAPTHLPACLVVSLLFTRVPTKSFATALNSPFSAFLSLLPCGFCGQSHDDPDDEERFD